METTRSDARLLAASAARSAASSGSARPERRASRRFAPFGASLGLACEMRARKIPDTKETVSRGSDQSSRAGAPRTDGRLDLACVLVDVAGAPDVYEPITLPLDGNGPALEQRGATCTPHCGPFRAFFSRGDHV